MSKKTIGLFATGDWPAVKALAQQVRTAIKPDAADVLLRDAALLSAERGQLERFTAVAYADEQAGELVKAHYPDAVPVADLLPKAEPAQPVEPEAPPPAEPEAPAAVEAEPQPVPAPAPAAPTPARKRAAAA